MNTALISLGANTSDKQEILSTVIKEIALYAHIKAQTPIYHTAAEGSITQVAPYANALLIIETENDYATLHRTFKEREQRAGRTAQSKIDGIVPLDIDIVKWNDKILKERDMEFEFMKSGLALLNNNK